MAHATRPRMEPQGAGASPDGERLLGNAAFGRMELEAALTHYGRALTGQGSDAAVFSNISAVHLARGAPHAALDAARRAATLRPRWPKAYHRRGLALAALGRPAAAAAAFRRALELGPGDPGAAARLAEAELSASAARCRADLRGHAAPVYAVAFAPPAALAAPHPQGDCWGPVLATASLDGAVGLWAPGRSTDAGCLAESSPCPSAGASAGAGLSLQALHEDKVTVAVWSPIEALLATGSLDRTARLWRLEPGGEGPPSLRPVGVLVGHEGRVVAAQFTPSGALLATCSTDKTARLWDVSRCVCTATLRGHRGIIPSLSVAPSGEEGGCLLATACGDGTARLWTVSPSGEGELTSELAWATGLSKGGVSLVSFTPGAPGALLTCHSDPSTGEARALAWDTAGEAARAGGGRPPAPAHAFDGYRGAIESLDCCEGEEGGGVVATGSADGAVRIWDLDSGEEVLELRPGTGAVAAVRFSPCGRLLATAGADGAVRVWEAETGRAAGPALRGHGGPVKSLAWWAAPGGRELLLASAGGAAGAAGEVRVWEGPWGVAEEE